jgi:hypothetical protein
MTVNNLPRRSSYVGDGTTVTFAVPFQFFEVDVYVAGVLASPVLYTVFQSSPGATGSVTFLTAPDVGASVVIAGATVIEQQVDYVDNDAFPAETHERALDRLTMIDQERSRDVEYAIRVPITAAPPAPLDLTGIDGKVLVGDAVTGLRSLDNAGVEGVVTVDTAGVASVRELWAAAGTASTTREYVDIPDVVGAPIVLPTSGGGTGAPTAYVDAQDAAIEADLAALDARVVVLEGGPPPPVTGPDTGYWGSIDGTTAIPDCDLVTDSAFFYQSAVVGTSMNAPNGNPTDSFTVAVIKDEWSDQLTQVAWPCHNSQAAGVQIRFRSGPGVWTAWQALGGGGGGGASAADVAALQASVGVASGVADLGTFAGATIPDNQTVKSALQVLETQVELLNALNANKEVLRVPNHADTLTNLDPQDVVLVDNDGDGKWALYFITSILSGNKIGTATKIKIADEDSALDLSGKVTRAGDTMTGDLSIVRNLPAATMGMTIQNTDSVALSRAQFTATSGVYTVRMFQDAGGGYRVIGNSTSGIVGLTSSAPLYLMTNNQVRLSVLADGRIGFGTSGTVTTGASVDASEFTDSMIPPRGTSAQRPATPTKGMHRFNSTNNVPEWWDGSAWIFLQNFTFTRELI